MKTVKFRIGIILGLILILSPVLFFSCEKKTEVIKEQPKDTSVVFSGLVKAPNHQPIDQAQVDVNGSITKTDKYGKFSVALNPSKDRRYVLNISQKGYSLISKIYHTGIKERVYIIESAKVVTIDPTKSVTVIDDIKKHHRPMLKYDDSFVARNYDANGSVIGFGLSKELKEAYSSLAKATPNVGASVSFRANTIVDENGTAPSGNVNVAISTINLLSPDGMPGDYTVDSNEPTYMVSYGAASVEIYDDNRTYNLKKGENATIRIPVDPTTLVSDVTIENTIPLLSYDRKNGLWKREGTATLDKKAMAYVGEVSHFSEFNMDVLRTNPACVRFCIFDEISGNWKIEVTIPRTGGLPPKVHEKIIDESVMSSCADTNLEIAGGPALCRNYVHLLYNLPLNTPISIRLKNIGGAVVASYVVYTGETALGIGGGNNKPPCPFTGCCKSGNCMSKILVLKDEVLYNPTLATPRIVNVATGKLEASWYFNGAVASEDLQLLTSPATSNDDCETGTWTSVTTVSNIRRDGFITRADLTVSTANSYKFKILVNGVESNCVFLDVP